MRNVPILSPLQPQGRALVGQRGDHGAAASGGVASALSSSAQHPSTAHPRVPARQAPVRGPRPPHGRRDTLGCTVEASGPSCLVGFRAFPCRFWGLLVLFSHCPLTPWHNEACLTRCHAMDSHGSSLQCQPDSFLMQCIHLYIVCVKFDRKVYLLHCKYM